MSDNRKDLPPITSPNFLEKVREALGVYLGNRGDALDRGVTLRDLTDSGMVTLRPGYGSNGGSGRFNPIGGAGPNAGGAYEIDLMPPPTPSDFTATAAISNLLIGCGAPTYTQGHGHARSVLYGATWTIGPPPVFDDAAVLTEFTGTVASHATNPSTTWHLWLKWVTVDGVYSTVPAGGTNGVVKRTGEDVALLLEAMTGKITESQLFGDLETKIDLIDGIGPKSVSGRVRASIDSLETTKVGYATKVGSLSPFDGDGVTLLGPAVAAVTGVDEVAAVSAVIANPNAVPPVLAKAAIAAVVGVSPVLARPAAYRILEKKHVDAWNASAAGVGNQAVWNIGLPLATVIKQVGVTVPAYAIRAGAVDTVLNTEAKVNTWNTNNPTDKAVWIPATTLTIEDKMTALQQANGKLYAQKSVKIGAGNSVVGYGLSGEVGADGGIIESKFIVNVDQFAVSTPKSSIPLWTAYTAYARGAVTRIASLDTKTLVCTRPGNSGANAPDISQDIGVSLDDGTARWQIASRIPFSVAALPFTYDGIEVPAGALMDGAYIRNATIDSATIKSVKADSIETGYLSAVTSHTGALYNGVEAYTLTTEAVTGKVTAVATSHTPGTVDFGTGYYLSNNKFFAGSPTNHMLWNGTALTVRGTVYATAGEIGGNTIDSTGIQSPGYSAGVSGWRLNSGGSAEFASTSIRGLLTASQIDARGLSIKDAAGNIILAAGTALSTSNITGLGSLATQSSVGYSSITGAKPPSDADKTSSNVAASVTGQTAFATLSQINSSNISTYIAGAAIQTAQIGNAAITNALIGDAQITYAKIGDAQVDTLKIAGNAVSVSNSASGGESGVDVSTTLFLKANVELKITAQVYFSNYGVHESSTPETVSLTIDGQVFNGLSYNVSRRYYPGYGDTDITVTQAAAIVIFANKTITSTTDRTITITASGGFKKTLIAFGLMK